MAVQILLLRTVLTLLPFFLPIACELILLILHHRARKNSTRGRHLLFKSFRGSQGWLPRDLLDVVQNGLCYGLAAGDAACKNLTSFPGPE